MFWRIILNIILIILAVLLQISLINRLPLGFGYVNLLLVLLVYLLILLGPKPALYWFIGSGWLLDILSFNYWGLHLAASLLIYFLAVFLLTNVFTNRSLYSLIILVVAATLTYDLITAPLVLENWRSFLNVVTWQMELKKVVANSIATIFLFYIFNLLTTRVQPVFLRQSKKY